MSVFDELNSLCVEMNELISDLSRFDSDVDDDFYQTMIRDYCFDNKMLRNRLKKVKKREVNVNLDYFQH